MCPLKKINPECANCLYAKEGLCDYPYIGAVKAPVEVK